MINLLERYVAEKKDTFVSPRIIHDIFKLVIDKRGKIAAASGEHDDSIMAFLMILYVLHYGNNLSYFGFKKGKLPGENEANKGLYQGSTSLEDLDEVTRAVVQNSIQMNKTMDDYNRERQRELAQARLETAYMNKFSSNQNNFSVQSLDVENGSQSSLGSDFFSFLNS